MTVAYDAGALVDQAEVSDVVDVHVVLVAHRQGYGVVTSDERDLRPIVTALGRAVPLIRV